MCQLAHWGSGTLANFSNGNTRSRVRDRFAVRARVPCDFWTRLVAFIFLFAREHPRIWTGTFSREHRWTILALHRRVEFRGSDNCELGVSVCRARVATLICDCARFQTVL